MSINFSPAIILWPPDQIVKQDVYFQPALTWTRDGVQGVALLFLENNTDSAEADKQDFRELVKGLVRWVWAAAGNNETDVLTLAAVQAVYTTLSETVLSYDDLRAFLSAHYRFEIQECGKDMQGAVFPMFPSLELEVGTVKPVISFSPANKKLDEAKINALRRLSAQLQVQFEAGTQPPTIEAESVAAFLFTGYARLLMRTGLQAIIDHLETVKASDDIISVLNTDDIISVLNTIDTAYGNIARMASRFLLHGISLPADILDSDDTTADDTIPADAIPNKGLYVCTGQQFEFFSPSGTDDQAPSVALRMGEVAEDHIMFPETDSDGRPQLVYSIPNASEPNSPDENDPKLQFLALANALKGLPKETVLQHSAEPKTIPFYGEELLHFALRGRVTWEKDPSTTDHILPLPTTLLDHLSQRRVNPVVDLIFWPNGNPSQTVDIANDNFNWATRIDVTILRLPHPDGEGFLQEIYEVGGSRESEQDRLEAILTSPDLRIDDASIKIDILHGQGGTTNPVMKNVPGTQDASLLLKANLSTETSADPPPETPADPPPEFGATLANKQAFLTRLWESLDVETGGFYLHLPHGDANFDAALFGGRNSAVLTFLIQFTAPSDPIHNFNTCAVLAVRFKITEPSLQGLRLENASDDVKISDDVLTRLATISNQEPTDKKRFLEILRTTIGPEQTDAHASLILKHAAEIDVERDLVLARSQESIPVLNMPPGFLGFQIDDRPKAPDVNDIGLRELNVLYQLLGWRVAAPTPFQGSQLGLPIGPTDPPGSNDPPPTTWLYERLVPVFSLFTPPPPDDSNADPSELPPRQRDPYLGIGTASGDDESELKIETWWQDIYGNPFLASQTNKTFPIRYTDPLIGINQWPSVAEHYTFVEENGVRRLDLNFSFDPFSYSLAAHAAAQDPAVSRINRITSDKATIEKVYYQILQEDVTFTLSTSIDDTWPAPDVDKERLLKFVGDIYQYFDKVLNPLPTAPPAPYTQRIDASEIKVRNAFIFQVTVTLQMSRDLDLILDELKLNGSIKPEHENVLRAPATLSPKFESATLTVTNEQKTLAALATAASKEPPLVFSAVDLLTANPSHPGLLVAGLALEPSRLTPELSLFNIDAQDWVAYVALDLAPMTIEAGDTPALLAKRFRSDMQDKLDRTVNFTIADLAAILANDVRVLNPGAVLRVGELNLRPFADHFQKAFPGVLLAVSEDRNVRNRPSSTRLPLYAVRLGSDGITYDIQEQRPVYFAIPPLANALLADTVPIHQYATWASDLDNLEYDPESDDPNPVSEDSQFEAIDLNVLARHFLVALETFLDPATLVPAHRLLPDKVDRILQHKTTLATKLSDSVLPILQNDVASDATEAKKAIRQELLVDLVKGYDIETIVQFAVQVTVGSALTGVLDWEPGLEPRVRGRAHVRDVKVGENPVRRVSITPDNVPDKLDFTISAGQISLRNKSDLSTLTYLFDTKTPELFANLELDLEFIPAELEFDIVNLTGVTDRQASNFLSFVRPSNLQQSMGSSPVPIPLRHYPMPPSLIFQRAEADPTSLTVLADVRQWKYSVVYEHPDVSQDSIDCILQLNLPQVDNLPTVSGGISPPTDLFKSLVNFGEVYPQLAIDLKRLQLEGLVSVPGLENDRKRATKAMTAFEFLVSRVVKDWSASATSVHTYSPTKGDLHFEIHEESGTNPGEREGLVTTLQTVASKIGGPAIEPTLALPGSKEKDLPIREGQTITFTFEPDPGDLTFFGDSSVPDRKFIVENLDVIEHQNAWASVWLSRNKQLIRDAAGPVDTNLAFVFQTPAVRFNTMVNPFITNDEIWDIATLDSADDTPQRRPLEAHLSTLIRELFPSFPGNKYEVRLSCRYAFSLATGRGLNEDLVTTLPILLGLRISPEDLAATYATSLRDELQIWLRDNRPSTEKASLIFSVDLFSKLDENSDTSLPMLRITHLGLALDQIADLTTPGE